MDTTTLVPLQLVLGVAALTGSVTLAVRTVDLRTAVLNAVALSLVVTVSVSPGHGDTAALGFLLLAGLTAVRWPWRDTLREILTEERERPAGPGRPT